jgi:serine O-acetyltransferase
MTLRDYLNADWKQLYAFAGREAPRRGWLSNFSPRFAPVFFIRLAQRAYQKGWPRLAKLCALFNYVVFSLEVPTRLEIGSGLVLPHPTGTILGACSIGSNVTIYQQVTLGAKFADFDYVAEKRPLICDGAVITAGAKVLGSIRIGVNAIVGANAVVLVDVPDECIAIGVPATIRHRTQSER